MLRMRMRWAMRLAAAAVLPAFLQGCGAAAIQIPTLMQYDGYEQLDKSYNRGVAPLTTTHFTFPKPIELKCVEQGARCTFGGAPLPAGLDQQGARNFVQNELMRRSDQLCSLHISRMLYGHAMGNVGSRVIKGAFASINAITDTAENFADAMIENTNVNFGSDELVRWKAMTDTAVRIEKSRGALRNNIRKAQAIKDTSSYDLSQAIYDAERYHQLCSFSNVYMVGEQVETVAGGTILVPEAPAEKAKEKTATKPAAP